jgi:electron transfer flavoprotein beta subunit
MGEAAAIEQVRGAMAMGIDNGILIETDGREFGTKATAKAIVEAIQKQREEGNAFDMLFFGNESADSGAYQVGIRVAHALDLPCITGVKSLEFEGKTAIAKREGMGGTMEVFEIELPAVFTIKEGINVPRYPTMPGRMRAKRAKIPQYEAEWFAEGLDKVRLKNPPESGKEVQILGEGIEATGKIVELLKELRIVE